MLDSNTKMLVVVDDFVTMTRVMKTLIQRIGFSDVDICHDGDTALEMLRAREYGIVLCDTDPVNGAEFARLARAEPNGSRCIIVLTTASRESVMKAVLEGVHLLIDGFIPEAF